MSQRRRVRPHHVRKVSVPAAHHTPLPKAQIVNLLADGRMEPQGIMPWSSNYTFLMLVCDGPLEVLAIYKPCRGERPLWDFPYGTLCKREYAAYLVSEALNWNLVPPTVLREGPHGLGSVQFFIDCEPDQHYFTLKEAYQEDFKRVAVFDILLNNTDRKGGHCLIDRSGKIWAIDHGVTFHCEPKLRTVIWDFAGQPIPRAIQDDLRSLQVKLAGKDPAVSELNELLEPDEIDALTQRLSGLLQSPRFPEPDSDWYTIPWPPV